MARMKAQSVLDPETGKLVQRDVPLTPEEEIAEDAKDAEWEAGKDDRERELLIEAEADAILEAENQSRREQAITALRQRGEIA